MLEIVLTREDANTEYALLAEWLVEDRSEVAAGQPVCVVETTKATVEVEAPGAGTIVQLYGEEVEVELGKTIAYVAETADELASIDAKAEAKPAPKPAAGDRKATRKAVELAELHGVDLAEIDKRGFITEKDVEALIAAQKASATPAAQARPRGRLDRRRVAAGDVRARCDATARSTRLSSRRSTTRRSARSRPRTRSPRFATPAPRIGDGVDLGEGSLVVAPRIVIEDGVRLGPRATVVCEEVVAIGELSQFGADLELRCRRAFLGAGHLGRALGHGSAEAAIATRGRRSRRRPRVRRRRGVRQRLPPGAHRPRGVPDDALDHRDAQHRALGARGLREPLRARSCSRTARRSGSAPCSTPVRASARRRSSRRTRTSSATFPRARFAIGVPAKATGSSSHKLSDARRLELARRFVDDLHELLALRGHAVSAIEDDGFEVEGTRVVVHRRATAVVSTRRPSSSRSTSAATFPTASR